GGDDALIICPLDRVLQLMIAVRKSWVKCAKGPTLTLHASVLHSKTPLQPALQSAFSDLLHAKEVKRDTFSLRIAPHSGVSVRMQGEWEELPSLVQAIESWGNWRVDEKTPPKNEERILRNASSLPGSLAYNVLG